MSSLVTGAPLGISLNDGVMDILVAPNTPLPLEVTKAYHTAKGDQRLVLIKVFQGGNRTAHYNHFLGELMLENMARSKKKTLRQIRVTLKVSLTGAMTATMACDSANCCVTKDMNIHPHSPATPVERALKGTSELLAAILGTDMQLKDIQPGTTIRKAVPKLESMQSADVQVYKDKVEELTQERDGLRQMLQDRLEAFKRLTEDYEQKLGVYKTELNKMSAKDDRIRILMEQVEEQDKNRIVLLDQLQEKIDQLNMEKDNLAFIHQNNIEKLQRQLEEKDQEFFRQRGSLAEQIQRLNEEKKTLQLQKEMEEADLRENLLNMRESFQVTKKRMQEELDRMEEAKNTADKSKWMEVAALRQELQNKETEHQTNSQKLQGGITELLTAIKIQEDHYQQTITTYAEERNNYVNLCKIKQEELSRLEKEKEQQEREQEEQLRKLEDDMREQNIAESRIKEEMERKVEELERSKTQQIKERENEITNLRVNIKDLKQQANDQASVLKSKIRDLKESRDLAVQQKKEELEKFKEILREESIIHDRETRELKEKLAELGDFGDEDKMRALQDQLRIKEEEYQKRSKEMQQRLISIDTETEENIRERDNKMVQLEAVLSNKEKEYQHEKENLEKEKENISKKNEEHMSQLAHKEQEIKEQQAKRKAELDIICYVWEEDVRKTEGPPIPVEQGPSKKAKKGANIEVKNINKRDSGLIAIKDDFSLVSE